MGKEQKRDKLTEIIIKMNNVWKGNTKNEKR